MVKVNERERQKTEKGRKEKEQTVNSGESN